MLESEIIKRLTALGAAYPHSNLSAKTFEVFARALTDLDTDVFDAVVEQCLSESEFFPTVARLREMAFTLTDPVNCICAAEGWGEVLEAIRKFGSYGTPTFSHPLIADVVKILNWQSLCSSENQIADRAHFIRIFEQLEDRRRRDSRLLPRARAIKQLYANQRALLEGNDAS